MKSHFFLDTKIWFTGPCSKYKKKKTKVIHETEEFMFENPLDNLTTTNSETQMQGINE